MPWRICLLHAFTSLGGYVCFLAAGLGSIIYLLMSRHTPDDEVADFFEKAQTVRCQLNTIYLVVGWSLLTLGLVVGSLQLRATERALLGWDAKQIATYLIWAYYTAAFIVALIRRRRSPEKVAPGLAKVAALGLLFLVANATVVNLYLTRWHRYF